MDKFLSNKKIFSSKWGKCHCQGMTMDKEKNFIYYSFTTKLVKTDFYGKVIGYVDNITGHLGCIDFNDEDGKVYASLEYKNDEIGRGILKKLGYDDKNIKDGFYIAIFDVDKIDRLNMDAETDGVMTTAYLKTVVDDFNGIAENGQKHVLGCSGIDGLAIGKDFGDTSKNGKNYLHVCYGVYGDLNRDDNDNQVILQYETEDLKSNAKVHKQSDMHSDEIIKPRNKYLLYTGNTTYGIQNLEYDEFTGDYIVCVYTGHKEKFPNFTNFVIDGSKKAENGRLSLKQVGLNNDNIYGYYQKLGGVEIGTMGIHSLGNGYFYIVDPQWEDADNLYVYTRLFKMNYENKETLFEEV